MESPKPYRSLIGTLKGTLLDPFKAPFKEPLGIFPQFWASQSAIFTFLGPPTKSWGILKGSWDLVLGVISKVSTVIITDNPN